MSDTPTIHAAMAAVMHDIGAVKKGDYNQHQKFNFRGIDALQNACYGPMCRHGVFVLPDVLEAGYADVQTSTGKPSTRAMLRVRFTFYGPAGDSVSAVTAGESMDSADKATNKAMAAAFKYALLQSFCIPTEGQPDADSEAPERGAPQPVEQPAPPAEQPKPPPLTPQQEAVKTAVSSLDDPQRATLKGLWTDAGLPLELNSLSGEQCEQAMKLVDKVGSVPF